MPRRADILWDLDGPEFEKLADMDAASKEGLGSVLGGWEQEDRFTRSSASLPANYEHTTEIIKNQCEMLATLIKGMRK